MSMAMYWLVGCQWQWKYNSIRRAKAKIILSGSEKNAKEVFLPNLPKSEIDDWGKNVQMYLSISHLYNGLYHTTLFLCI
jgi:hypothetical protein